MCVSHTPSYGVVRSKILLVLVRIDTGCFVLCRFSCFNIVFVCLVGWLVVFFIVFMWVLIGCFWGALFCLVLLVFGFLLLFKKTFKNKTMFKQTNKQINIHLDCVL